MTEKKGNFVWVLVPRLSERSDLSLSDPARRSRRPVPSRPVPSLPALPAPALPARPGGAWEQRGGAGCGAGAWGRRGCLAFPSLVEKLSQGVRRRFWPVRPVAFSLCVVFSFVSLESRPRLLFQPESSPLYLGNLPAGGKNADLGGLVFLLFPFILFKEKAGEESYYFPEGLFAWLRATE